MDRQEDTSGLKEDNVITTNDTTEMMDNHEDTSGAEGAYAITIEDAAEMIDNQESIFDVETMDNQDELELLHRKMHQKLTCKLQKADDFEEVTIFRAPLHIRESNKRMFEPSVVSIGPYYRGRPHLRAMEEKKWSFLQDFLHHAGCTLQDCISKIKKLEKRARCCYSESFDMSSDDFVEMMILDGCFIIEYFKNPIKEGWIPHFLDTDLLLLENQIPFFIIKTLNRSFFNPEIFVEMVRFLVEDCIPINAPSHPQKIHHLLHLGHCYTVPTGSTENVASESNHRPFLNWIRAVPVLKCFCLEKKKELGERKVSQIPSATELEEAGVKFKKLEQSRDITKITFRSGTLLIPRLHITFSFMPLLMNLVAFEQCMLYKVPSHFSTYMAFMDYLVNTTQDVKILQKNGIFDSMLSSEEDVALFFNLSSVELILKRDHYLAELFVRVNKYCESRCPRYRAKLSRDYFNNPWSIISLIAAVVLLLLTFAQSFMAVYSYIRPRS